VASLLRLDPLSPPARDIDDPQRRVPTLIRDVGDVLAVVGPARGSGVEVTVGERKGIAAFARHQPQLMPLAAEVGAVDDAPAVGRGVKMGQRGLYKDGTNARRPPSGDQRGSTFTAPFAVKARTVPAVRSSSSSSIASLA